MFGLLQWNGGIFLVLLLMFVILLVLVLSVFSFLLFGEDIYVGY